MRVGASPACGHGPWCQRVTSQSCAVQVMSKPRLSGGQVRHTGAVVKYSAGSGSGTGVRWGISRVILLPWRGFCYGGRQRYSRSDGVVGERGGLRARERAERHAAARPFPSHLREAGSQPRTLTARRAARSAPARVGPPLSAARSLPSRAEETNAQGSAQYFLHRTQIISEAACRLSARTRTASAGLRRPSHRPLGRAVPAVRGRGATDTPAGRVLRPARRKHAARVHRSGSRAAAAAGGAPLHRAARDQRRADHDRPSWDPLRPPTPLGK